MLKLSALSLSLLLLGCVSLVKTNESNELVFNARLETFKYPFATKVFPIFTQGQNLEMVYMDVSPTKTRDNKVAVLLHGKNFAGYYWERVAKELSQRGYRVIIVDQIGFGKSSKPKNYQYSFSQMAINTEQLLESLGIENYHLVGHSMGGMLGVTMAYLFPLKVKKLTLINPIGLETYLDYTEFKDTNFFYKIELAKNKEKAIDYQKKNYYDGQWRAEYEKLLEPTIGQMNGPNWDIVAWNNALTYGPIFYEDTLARLGKLKMPISLIIGTRDRTGPGRGWKRKGVNHKLGQYQKFGKRIKILSKNIKVLEIKGLGHMPQFENYEEFSKRFYPQFKL